MLARGRLARRLTTWTAGVAAHELLLARTHLRTTGRELAPGLDEAALAGADAATRAHELLWNADWVLLSHGTEPSPVLNYGNRAAMELFELDWDRLTALESRYTAPPDLVEERADVLRRVREAGFVDDYRGTRVSATGKRFVIERVTLWEVHRPGSGERLGMAAAFPRPAGT
jgi:hypothetical protein